MIGAGLALGLALLVVGRRPVVTARRPKPSPGDRAGWSPRRLAALAGFGAGSAVVVVLGPGRGLVVGALVAPVVAFAVARLARRRAGVDLGPLPLALDVLAALLSSGLPVPTALARAAPVAGPDLGEELRRVAGLLRLGAEPAVAWRGPAEHPALARVAAAACRSAESGIRLAAGFERVAVELRAQAQADGLARAERAAVWAMAPLGLCFLPAFVCTGVIPVIIGLTRSAFTGVGG